MLFKPKKVDPVVQAREWKKNLRAEMRKVDREVLAIQRSQKKVEMEIKQAAKRGDIAGAKILARDVVRAKKAIEKLYVSKAQMNSVAMQLQSQIANIKIAGCMAQSAEIMHSMNQLMKLPQMHQIMMGMAKEMQKAGLIEEMMEDAFDDMNEEEEEEANEEVEKAFLEITAGIMEKATGVGRSTPEKPQKEKVKDEDDAELERKMAALSSI